MNKTLEKVAAMSMVAAAMVATSCGTQKKAASENTNVSDAVVAYPDEAHEMDENYLILDDDPVFTDFPDGSSRMTANSWSICCFSSFLSSSL